MSIATLTGSLSIKAQWSATATVTGLGSGRSSTENPGKQQSFTVGTGANQVNTVYWSVVSLAGGANTTLDLSTGLTDVTGGTLAFTAIKGLMIWLLATGDTLADGTVGSATTSVTVGNAASNQFAGTGYPISDSATGTITLANGEVFGREIGNAAGWVVDGTHKSLKLLNNDGSVTAKIVIAALGVG